MAKFYRISNPDDVREIGDLIEAWITTGNPKANDWAEQPVAPSLNSVWVNGEWVTIESLPPYYETSTGIKLATQEHDQTAFTRMLALIDLTQMDPAEMVIIKDAAGEKHALSVADFKAMMAEYGAHCYTLHVGA